MLFRTNVVALLAAAAALVVGPAQAHKAHQHGTAKLDVAVEPTRVRLDLTTPLDNLVGFERAPRTDAERQRVDAAVAALRDAAALWRIDPAAGCTPGAVTVLAPVLGLDGTAGTPGATAASAATAGPAAAPAAAKDSHADLEASWTFDCRDAARTGFIEQGLFAAFARLSRIEVQAVTPRGQMKVTLRKPANRIALAR